MGTERRIDPTLIADAEALGIDVVAACEAGLTQAIRQAREAERLAQSRDAIAEWNGWVEDHALPLAEPRHP